MVKGYWVALLTCLIRMDTRPTLPRAQRRSASTAVVFSHEEANLKRQRAKHVRGLS